MRNQFLTLAVSSVLLVGGCDKAEDPTVQLNEVRSELASGNYGRAAALAEAFARTYPNDQEAHLLHAKAEARLGNAGNAARALEAAVLAGLPDPRPVLRDAAFDTVRGDAAFDRLGQAGPRSDATSTRIAAVGPSSREVVQAGDVSIVERDGREVIRAGDIVLQADD